jgi:hypothetical protein
MLHGRRIFQRDQAHTQRQMLDDLAEVHLHFWASSTISPRRIAAYRSNSSQPWPRRVSCPGSIPSSNCASSYSNGPKECRTGSQGARMTAYRAQHIHRGVCTWPARTAPRRPGGVMSCTPCFAVLLQEEKELFGDGLSPTYKCMRRSTPPCCPGTVFRTV